jgi:hypothetical protein
VSAKKYNLHFEIAENSPGSLPNETFFRTSIAALRGK